MEETIRFAIDDVVPSVRAILEAQGLPERRQNDERSVSLAEEAVSIFKKKAVPVGVIREVTSDEFDSVYDGTGLNDEPGPVKPVYRASERLALYAVTLGEGICAEIMGLFADREFALGSMLDSAASEGAERTAEALETTYQTRLRKAHVLDSRRGTLRFSPGYCGWHISGQGKLFDVLRPDRIGITLNTSYLMRPIKSISGVIIAGPKEIFTFDDAFSFCEECTTHECRERIQAVMRQ